MAVDPPIQAAVGVEPRIERFIVSWLIKWTVETDGAIVVRIQLVKSTLIRKIGYAPRIIREIIGNAGSPDDFER